MVEDLHRPVSSLFLQDVRKSHKQGCTRVRPCFPPVVGGTEPGCLVCKSTYSSFAAFPRLLLPAIYVCQLSVQDEISGRNCPAEQLSMSTGLRRLYCAAEEAPDSC